MLISLCSKCRQLRSLSTVGVASASDNDFSIIFLCDDCLRILDDLKKDKILD